MIEINEILSKLVLNKQLSSKVNLDIVKYLIEKTNGLYIEILGDYDGVLFDLMYNGRLEGWCWQTTESVILFLNDDDYIERGFLYFDERTPNYYHSWICFKYNEIEYVLDPCLNFICKKEDYTKVFKATVKARVNAKDVKKEFIKQITNSKKQLTDTSFDDVFKFILGDNYQKYIEEKKNEVVVNGPEDINTPLYRNGAGYTTEFEKGKIKKVKVHYYLTNW